MMEIFGFGAVVCEDYCIVLKCTLIVGSQEGLEPAGDYAFPLRSPLSNSSFLHWVLGDLARLDRLVENPLRRDECGWCT
jgi:hypothetical protein